MKPNEKDKGVALEFKTVQVADELQAPGKKNGWDLPDAILEDVPRSTGEVRLQLQRIIRELDENGIVTQNGEPYTVGSLAAMRDTAISWPPTERHDECAYRTHQEAGAPGKGRVILAALCAVARGEAVGCPDEADEAAWLSAAKAVTRKANKARPPRFLIAANDVRTAMGRKTNIPAAGPPAPTLAELSPDAVLELVNSDPHLLMLAAASALADPRVLAQVMTDTGARTAVGTAVNEYYRNQGKIENVREPSDRDAFASVLEDMGTIKKRLNAIIENVNGALRSGYLAPEIIHEFTGKVRIYADALDEIADTSEGMTDEMLSEKITQWERQ